MSLGRDRFDDDEKKELSKAFESNSLWPYSGKGFAPFMKQATDGLSNHFSTADRKAYVIPTASGTSSIQVALGGLKVPAGSEVIVTPITDPGTVTPIIFHNAIPVFADVDPASGLITPDSVEAVLTRRTSAVIAVHLTGSPVDVPGIRKRLDDLGRTSVKIIEDVAQGLGATLNGTPLGMMGDAGCFSLNSHKHISVGEGGFVLVSDKDDYFRCHNFSDKHRDRLDGGSVNSEHKQYVGPGHSLRMSELQGAMLVAQLPKLAGFAASRTAFGLALDARLTAKSNLVPQRHLPGAVPTFFGYMFSTSNEIDVAKKDAAIELVDDRIGAIESSIGGAYTHDDDPIYKYPLFLCRNFSENEQGIWPAELVAEKLYPNEITPGYYDYTNVSCTNAESYLRRSFWVRLHEKHTPAHAEQIADTIVEVFADLGIS